MQEKLVERWDVNIAIIEKIYLSKPNFNIILFECWGQFIMNLLFFLQKQVELIDGFRGNNMGSVVSFDVVSTDVKIVADA